MLYVSILFVAIPFEMKKSSRSVTFLGSVGQYVGLRADRKLQFLFLIAFSRPAPLPGVISLEPHSVCLVLKSPPMLNLCPNFSKISMC